VRVPVGDPRPRQPITFRAGPTDADNTGLARGAALYLQDQITLSPALKAIVGARYDRLRADFPNLPNGQHPTGTREPAALHAEPVLWHSAPPHA